MRGSRSSLLRRSAPVLAAAVVATGALAAPASAAPPERIAVIVQMTPGSDAAAEARRAAGNGGGSVSHVYRSAFTGFAGSLTQNAIDGLRNNPRVTLVEADGEVSTTETAASWGLDRIDQQRLPLNGTYTFPTSAGSGVTAYVVDTGVAPTGDLNQTAAGFDAVTTGGDGTADCNGHGTHVAGTIAGTRYGVAKEATVVPVRVLGCNGSGTWSGIIDGIEWAIDHHKPGVPAVANMSLGGSVNQSVDLAVRNLVADGVSVAVAAGNSNTNACTSSPARVVEAITTGATDRSDKRASFSNYGSCVDLFAPGVNITSAWIGGLTATNTVSGTSMATPHVAGAAAVLLSRQPGLSPGDVAASLTGAAGMGLIKNPGNGSPNRLLYSAP